MLRIPLHMQNRAVVATAVTNDQQQTAVMNHHETVILKLNLKDTWPRPARD